MSNEIKVGQIRVFNPTDQFGPLEFEPERDRAYKIIDVIKNTDLVRIEWLDSKKREVYDAKSTLLDRVLSELEKELL